MYQCTPPATRSVAHAAAALTRVVSQYGGASTFPSYLLSWMTSGAIQWGVPMKVFRLLMVLVS